MRVARMSAFRPAVPNCRVWSAILTHRTMVGVSLPVVLRHSRHQVAAVRGMSEFTQSERRFLSLINLRQLFPLSVVAHRALTQNLKTRLRET